jgi:hypothetical protein
MGKRLWKNTLEAEYGQGAFAEYIHEAKCLLQKNYGEDYDCTLTSLAAIFGEEHYALIESIAKKHGYDGKKNGTNPFTVKVIMQGVMDSIGIKGKCYSRYGKGVSFSWRTIGHLLDRGHHVVLNISKDGRSYYKNHSVLIVGVAYYSTHKLLAIYDNWNQGISYVDYDKLCMISSINWYE